MSNDPFLGVPAFVAVADQRSFSKAAAALGLTPGAISQAVTRLEEDLKIKLLDRTTRSVELTGEGRLYLEHCRDAMHNILAGRDRVEQAREAAEGEINVALPFVLGSLVIRLLPEFLARYPALNVRLNLSDRISRLVDEPIDVAVRIGKLADSTAVAKKLIDTQWVMLASPSYLARRGAPRTPDDLLDHDCIVYRSPRGYEVDWELLKRPGSTETQTANRNVRLVLDQGQLLSEAASGGVGLCMVFSFMVTQQLRSGELVPILPGYMAQGPPIHALVKPGAAQTAKVRVFLDFLAEQFRKLDTRALR